MMTRAVVGLHLQAKTAIRAVIRREAGATMVEYALMVALIALVAVAAVTVFGGAVADSFEDSASRIANG